VELTVDPAEIGQEVFQYLDPFLQEEVVQNHQIAALTDAHWVEFPIGQPAEITTRAGIHEASPLPPKRVVKRGPRNILPTITKAIDIFELFYDNSIYNTFVENTNSYAVHTNRKGFKPTDKTELRKLWACFLYLGVIKVSQRELIWKEKSIFAIPFIQKLFTRNQFEELLHCVHWKDASQLSLAQRRLENGKDAFWTVESFLGKLTENFRKYYVTGREVDIDEMSIYFKGRHRCKCYNPNKPEKWHFKAYCLNCAETGYLWNFFMYRGRDEERDENVSATLYPVVKLLSHSEYDNKGHVLSLDNWYTSMDAAKVVKEKGMDLVGTIRVNKKGIPKKGIFKKTGKDKKRRGESKCYEASIDGNKYYFTAWMDNNPVHILSTFPPRDKPIKRNSKNKNGDYEQITLPRPDIIGTYNSGMGGTDLFDQYGSYYRTTIRCKRWQVRFFTHFLHAACTNAYIIYKDIHMTTISYLDFLTMLINELATVEVDSDSEMEKSIVQTPPRTYQYRTTWLKDMSRLSGIHNPIVVTKHERRCCIVCPGNKKVNTCCSTCNVALCFDKKDSCWEKFHHRPHF
jgi:hypothetical protein